MDQIKQIKVSDIKVGEHEQRLEKEDEEINSIAASIKRVGILNPLLVADRDGELHIIAGHRRLIAARLAGCKDVPCIIRESKKGLDAEITFAENFFRRDLSPVELACAIKDCYTNETMTVQEMAESFHKKEHWVTSMMAIADWPEDVQVAVHNKAISVSAASNLALVNDSQYRAFLVKNAGEHGATARTTAAWLQAWRAMQPPEQAVQAEPVPAGQTLVPLIPQAPCLCCNNIFPVNQMSHVPMCGECIQVIRKVRIQ